MISIIVLLAVFVLIAVRQVGRIKVQIWQAMLLGAVAVLVSGQISPAAALRAINPDVMLFLFGMLTVGQAMEESGYLSRLSLRLFGRARSVNSLLILVLFGAGFLSAILLNDTLAIIGTPVILRIAHHTGIRPKVLLICLAFSITIGSVMSPIGNPQNLLIAINGEVRGPFITFLKYLAAPTVINLLLTFFILKLFYRNDLGNREVSHAPEHLRDPRLAGLCRVSLFIVLGVIAVKIALVLSGWNVDFRLTYIALAGAFPILVFSPRRFEIARKIDWFTLIFFAAMFVLMESVWDAGFFQEVLKDLNIDILSSVMILAVSVVLSQFISNVPMVALYLPLLLDAGAATRELMALAAGSTIAGNLSILGAASNVIIIQNAENKAGETVTFWEFFKIGVPVTAINVLFYWLFLRLF